MSEETQAPEASADAGETENTIPFSYNSLVLVGRKTKKDRMAYNDCCFFWSGVNG